MIARGTTQKRTDALLIVLGWSGMNPTMKRGGKR